MEEFLKTQGISNLVPCKTQGFMSEVFVGDMKGEKVIIHHTHPNEEQQHQDVKNKIIYVARMLTEKGFPCTPIIASTSLSDGSYVLVQKRLPGEALGKRDYDGKDFHDKLDKTYVKPLMKLAYELHNITLEGFGVLKEGRGTHKTWRLFLENEGRQWIKNIYENEPKTMSDNDKKNIEKVMQYLLQHPGTDWKESRYIHGDIVNPSNVLVENGKITGVLDFEWGLVGDPAWDFAFTDLPLDEYIKVASESPQTFLERVKVIRFFWLLWGTNVHAKGEFKPVLYRLFMEEVAYWQQQLT